MNKLIGKTIIAVYEIDNNVILVLDNGVELKICCTDSINYKGVQIDENY